MLSQSQDGTFHLFWNRSYYSRRGIYDVFYATSDNGLDWSPEVQVTSGSYDDAATSVLRVGTSEVRLYLTSAQRGQRPGKYDYNADLFVMRCMDGGRTWGEPVLLENASSPTEEDRFASVIQTGHQQFVMLFNRQQTPNLFDPTSDVFYATSLNGLTWTTAHQITSDPADSIHDLWPTFQWVPSRNGWFATWCSTDLGGGMIAVPLNSLDNYPEGAVNFSLLPGPLSSGERSFVDADPCGLTARAARTQRSDDESWTDGRSGAYSGQLGRTRSPGFVVERDPDTELFVGQVSPRHAARGRRVGPSRQEGD